MSENSSRYSTMRISVWENLEREMLNTEAKVAAMFKAEKMVKDDCAEELRTKAFKTIEVMVGKVGRFHISMSKAAKKIMGCMKSGVTNGPMMNPMTAIDVYELELINRLAMKCLELTNLSNAQATAASETSSADRIGGRWYSYYRQINVDEEIEQVINHKMASDDIYPWLDTAVTERLDEYEQEKA